MSAQRRTHIGKHRGGKPNPRPGSTLCASLRSGNAYEYVKKAILHRNLQDKCRKPSPQEAFYWKFTGQMPDPSVLCTPAQSKRTWTFHRSHFEGKFTGKMSDPPVNTSIEHRAFYTHCNNPFSMTTLFGEISQNDISPPAR